MYCFLVISILLSYQIQQANQAKALIIFNRPPRIQRNLPEDTVDIPRPPEPQFKGDRLSILVLILPVALAVLTVVAMVWAVDDFALVQDEAAIKKLFEVGTELGVFIIVTAPDLGSIPTQCRAILEMLPTGRVRYSTSGEKSRITTLQPDMATIAYCEAYALAMAPLKLKVAGDKGEMGSSLRLLDIMGLPTDPNNIFDPLTLWNRSSVGTLKVPVGVVFGGQELYLDVSDKGHGPHGLLAGTTGSGKSELLLTIVSALALANHHDNLNFILGDFKGGRLLTPL